MKSNKFNKSSSATQKTIKPPINTTKSTKPTIPPPLILSIEYKTLICSQSYLGKKGYTIPKSILTKEDEIDLREELMVRPIIMGSFGDASPEQSFPVYRESQQKIYIPRFYGIQRYGFPSYSEIKDGDDICVPFIKPLRDYQEKIIDIYIKSVGGLEKGGGILEVPCGRGKTVIALKIISLLKKKTLILVHKEFLMNQWIERITEFLPNAKVGHIQGKIMDTEGKDIVIGMIQSLYDRTFEPEFFSQFGLTIIDEVHRIGSEQFSKTLLKTITPYMLGISATVDRKDKLTKVLNMFIGDKIYTEKRDCDDLVCVRAIEYNSNDEEFNEMEYDYRGNPKYSTMISKLCAFNPRSDFIVRTIRDLILENEDGQIMVLAHNRSLLTYLYDAITQQQIGSVGYYVGGMKQAALLETETKRIVLATYAMAAEALDIKSLSILVMITPKTDIVQSVGRILRVKHDNPVVVDIVDKHDIFQNQWRQRMRFYKQCNYRIRYINSAKYGGMSIDWEKDMTWRRIFEPKKTFDCAKNNDADTDANTDSYTNINRKCLINTEYLDEESDVISY